MRPSSVAILLPSVSALLLAAGCTTYPTFGFPVEEGSIEAGRQAFIDHQCQQCHTVAGVRLPEIAGSPAPMLELGGETSRVKAYSQLVSSIIHPDHRIAERYREEQRRPVANSPMSTRHIETMTLRELIDVVAFLDSRYVLIDDYEYPTAER